MPQGKAAAPHAAETDIQHIKQLQHAVEQADAELEACLENLSLLNVRAGKGKQLVATMQVLSQHPAFQVPLQVQVSKQIKH